MRHTDFALAGGSVMGRDHRLVPKNNQDAWYISQDDCCSLAVVADGCGSIPHSEVGAKLGVRLLAEAIQAEVREFGGSRIDWHWIRRRLLASLDGLARQMGGSYRRTVEEYFLFTLVGVVLAGDTATFFALGDGVVIVNGRTHRLGPFPGNAPPYIGYGLLARDYREPAWEDMPFTIIGEWQLDNLAHFLLGSDGVTDLIDQAGENLPGLSEPVGGIEQFWEQDRYFRNPELVSRRLKLLARDWPKQNPETGLLHDDTTIIVGRWNPTDAHPEGGETS